MPPNPLGASSTTEPAATNPTPGRHDSPSVRAGSRDCGAVTATDRALAEQVVHPVEVALVELELLGLAAADVLGVDDVEVALLAIALV